MAKTLTQIFNESVKRPPKKQGRGKSFKPSMVGSPCLRKIFYSYNKVAEDQGFPLKNARITLLGDAIEEMLIEKWRKAGVVIDYYDENGKTPIVFGKPSKQFPVTCKELDINWGFLDAVVVLGDKLWIAEIKSINERGYTEDLSKGFKSDHYIQNLIYFFVFNKLLKEGAYDHIKELKPFKKAEGIRFFYYNKNTSVSKETVVKPDIQDFKKVLMRREAIVDYTNRKVLPPKTPHFCSSCSWNEKCEKDILGI